MLEGVLGAIVAHKREEVARRFDGVSLDSLRSFARPSGRSLYGALAQPGARFILEIKKASPSNGAIAKSARADAIARAYGGVADALSVLTDERFFAGSINDLKAARAAFDGPILAKDFFVDARQAVEARIAGADAILVMLSVLNDAEARAMIAEAERLGMSALVEVHDEGEMRRAVALGASLVGINNRDLRDLNVDLATTDRLAGLAGGALLISESGIGSRGDVERLARHVDGFLVGGALMREDDPAFAARHLVFGRTKLCGLRTLSDIDSGRAAAFAGFVLVPGSPRNLSLEDAEPLAAHARRKGVRPVGIFRDSKPAGIVEAARLLNLHAVQLHGSESEREIAKLRRLLPDATEIWVAASVETAIRPRRGGNRPLFDHGSGGSGQSFDWALLDGYPGLGRAILAGGIGPSNARRARAVGAYAIDVGSSLDRYPGQKSQARIAALFDALRADSRKDLEPCA